MTITTTTNDDAQEGHVGVEAGARARRSPRRRSRRRCRGASGRALSHRRRLLIASPGSSPDATRIAPAAAQIAAAASAAPRRSGRADRGRAAAPRRTSAMPAASETRSARRRFIRRRPPRWPRGRGIARRRRRRPSASQRPWSLMSASSSLMTRIAPMSTSASSRSCGVARAPAGGDQVDVDAVGLLPGDPQLTGAGVGVGDDADVGGHGDHRSRRRRRARRGRGPASGVQSMSRRSTARRPTPSS